MRTNIFLPSLVAGMKEGTLSRWLKQSGDAVRKGEPIAEIETDKAGVELEAPEDGVLSELLVEAGTQGLPVNSALAVLLTDGDDTDESESGAERNFAGAPQSGGTREPERLDVPSSAPASLPYTLVPLSENARAVANRLTKAKATIPHYYLTVDFHIDRLLSARRAISDKGAADARISVNDMLIRAVALALKAHPKVNAVFAEDGIHQLHSVDIAVAVSIEGGLVTPIVKNADHKSLQEIAASMADLSGRARAKRLKPEEYQGGSFTISNLGMFGIREFSAIINPPQSCILAVGAAERRAIVSEETVKPATVVSATLSADHRVLNGVEGAVFLKSLKHLLESADGVSAICV